MATVDDIKAALANITWGEWKWHGIVGPNWLPQTVMAADNLRVERPSKMEPGEEIVFVVEAMKSGFVMVRNADAVFIANAPNYMRTLLARIDALEKVADAAREFAAHEDLMSDAFEVLSQTWHKAQLAETSVMRSQFEALQAALAALDASANG